MKEIQLDASALERLLGERWAPLVSYVRRQVGDVDLAKDIAQDAFVRLWERRRDLDPARSVVAYLYQIARRGAIDELRRRDVRARWTERERRPDPGATGAEAPLHLLATRDLLLAVEREIAKLPGRCREAFTLVHVENLTHREAAEVMGTAPQTVANQVASALKVLRRALHHLVAEPDPRVRPAFPTPRLGRHAG